MSPATDASIYQGILARMRRRTSDALVRSESEMNSSILEKHAKKMEDERGEKNVRQTPNDKSRGRRHIISGPQTCFRKSPSGKRSSWRLHVKSACTCRASIIYRQPGALSSLLSLPSTRTSASFFHTTSSSHHEHYHNQQHQQQT